jgi:hypothetical protein
MGWWMLVPLLLLVLVLVVTVLGLLSPVLAVDLACLLRLVGVRPAGVAVVHKDVEGSCGPLTQRPVSSDAGSASIKHIACGLGGIPACSWFIVQPKHDCRLPGSASGAPTAAIVP